MSFTWTPHRFVGGALALDVANSVILRHDAEARRDRFAVAEQLQAFPEAALHLSAERQDFPALQPVPEERCDAFLNLREAIDRYFRSRTLGDEDRLSLADLLERIAETLRAQTDGQSLDQATARSALRLVCEPDPERMKICGHCGWLFLDRSKNRSRSWCDMAVCGNRVKASRHYNRKKTETLP
jgi:predicted RNA-binding Zn ribbon-like protein